MYKIGIVARPDMTVNNNKVWEINDEIRRVILKYNGIPMIIVPIGKDDDSKMTITELNNLKNQLSLCDGFIFQGGDDYIESDFQILDYCYQNNIPTFGICLGMQTMGCYLGYQLKDVSTTVNHHQKGIDYVHLVNILPNSQLFNITNQLELKVNSRHKQCLTNNLKYTSAFSSDDIVEAIEDNQKDFFIGVQWHPESMIEYDKVSCRLFEEFFKLVGSHYENRKIVRGNINKRNIQ